MAIAEIPTEEKIILSPNGAVKKDSPEKRNNLLNGMNETFDALDSTIHEIQQIKHERKASDILLEKFKKEERELDLWEKYLKNQTSIDFHQQVLEDTAHYLHAQSRIQDRSVSLDIVYKEMDEVNKQIPLEVQGLRDEIPTYERSDGTKGYDWLGEFVGIALKKREELRPKSDEEIERYKQKAGEYLKKLGIIDDLSQSKNSAVDNTSQDPDSQSIQVEDILTLDRDILSDSREKFIEAKNRERSFWGGIRSWRIFRSIFKTSAIEDINVTAQKYKEARNEYIARRVVEEAEFNEDNDIYRESIRSVFGKVYEEETERLEKGELEFKKGRERLKSWFYDKPQLRTAFGGVILGASYISAALGLMPREIPMGVGLFSSAAFIEGSMHWFLRRGLRRSLDQSVNSNSEENQKVKANEGLAENYPILLEEFQNRANREVPELNSIRGGYKDAIIRSLNNSLNLDGVTVSVDEMKELISKHDSTVEDAIKSVRTQRNLLKQRVAFSAIFGYLNLRVIDTLVYDKLTGLQGLTATLSDSVDRDRLRGMNNSFTSNNISVLSADIPGPDHLGDMSLSSPDQHAILGTGFIEADQVFSEKDWNFIEVRDNLELRHLWGEVSSIKGQIEGQIAGYYLDIPNFDPQRDKALFDERWAINSAFYNDVLQDALQKTSDLNAGKEVFVPGYPDIYVHGTDGKIAKIVENSVFVFPNTPETVYVR